MVIKINGIAYTATACTAYLPTLDETESNRRDMTLIDANEHADTDEINNMLIPEYLEDGEDLPEWDSYWSTDCDDLSTIIVD